MVIPTTRVIRSRSAKPPPNPAADGPARAHYCPCLRAPHVVSATIEIATPPAPRRTEHHGEQGISHPEPIRPPSLTIVVTGLDDHANLAAGQILPEFEPRVSLSFIQCREVSPAVLAGQLEQESGAITGDPVELMLAG